jgi:hypothetical protein
MIRFQVVERTGANLRRTLLEAMRSGDLRTFVARRRGRRIEHKSLPGWMNWEDSGGLIACEVLSPHNPGTEWQLFHRFLGRLADRYADRIASIHVHFPESIPFETRAPGKRRRR